MDLLYYLEVIFRLILAAVLGGIVGAERESENKNAGFRTNILVCIASALTMITSEYIFNKYSGVANIDPARLGAQVISGIGFLGAGAIIRDGFGIKGLTTAASLWAVACVGLACGIGFYEGAIFATLIIIIVLLTLKRLGNKMKHNSDYVLIINSLSLPQQISNITSILSKNNIGIDKIMISEDKIMEAKNYLIKIILNKYKKYTNKMIETTIEEIQMLDDIYSVECKGNFSNASSYDQTIEEMDV